MCSRIKACQPHLLCAAFLLLLAIPTVIFTASELNLHQLENQARKNAYTISQGVGERIGVINTVLASLVGLNDVITELDDDKLQRFSRDILQNAPYIRNLGSYARVPHEQRKAFEAKMSHNRYSDFSIAQLGQSGQYTIRKKHDIYYPVSIAGPRHLTVPGLVGTDLGSLPQFSSALETINTDSMSTVVALPDQWPLKGDLFVLRPFNPNSDINSPIQTTSWKTGGFWLTLDTEHLFAGLTDLINQYDVSIELMDTNGRTNLHSIQSINSQSLYFTDWYSRRSLQETWDISPSTKVVITLHQPIGLTAGAIVITAITLLLVVLTSGLLTRYVLTRRETEIVQKLGLQTLFKEREKAEETLNSVQDAIITLDSDLRVMHINPAAVILFNTRASVVVGESLTALARFHRASDCHALLNIELELSNLNHDGKKEFDVVPAGQNDEDFVFRMSLSSSKDHEGHVTGYVIVLRDISHERRLTRKLAYQANYDALTGCTNRHFFEQSLERLIDEMPASGQTHTLCYMDLDQFKIVNDTCGHRAGDQLLIELTKNMQHMIRDEDVLSRLGGDEFGLILVGVDREMATLVAERIYQFFQNFNFTHQGNTFSITASIGVVHIDSLCANSKDIMASADIACYAAKDSGRNSMSVYSKSDESMAERSEELNWLPRLQNALHNDEFRLHAQAVASLNPEDDNHPIRHFEFLLRLADNDGTEVTPWQFIQAAERYDLMREIDRWVIRNALQKVAQYADGAGRDCSYSINLSGQSAADPTLKAFIQNQIRLHKVDPSRIWFELTETAAISHFSVAVDLIKNIRTTGAKVALDDFGSGLSSFGYLKNLPVDVIKIDGQFVKEIVKNPIDREMVRAIHRVGESMHIETVAEFVENQAIVDELVKIGVNYAQGYHIGKPMPLDQALAVVDDSSRAA